MSREWPHESARRPTDESAWWRWGGRGKEGEENPRPRPPHFAPKAPLGRAFLQLNDLSQNGYGVREGVAAVSEGMGVAWGDAVWDGAGVV